jgi:hypothetical protein
MRKPQRPAAGGTVDHEEQAATATQRGQSDWCARGATLPGADEQPAQSRDRGPNRHPADDVGEPVRTGVQP